jgi:hypothetical protein
LQVHTSHDNTGEPKLKGHYLPFCNPKTM